MENAKKSSAWAWQDKSTAATIGLFLVSGITGIMLFLKIGEGAVKGVHEWLSVAFVLACILHVIRHWRPLQRYFAMRFFWGITVVVMLLAVVMMVPGTGGPHGPGGGRNPMMQVMGVLSDAHLEHLALTMNTTSDKLVEKLRAAGITVQNPQQTLKEVATGSNCDLRQVMSVVMTEEVTR